MTIILFLIDTSSSMCQKAYVNGVQKSYLDVAKASVETFLKYRQRSQDCLGDRYMLLTFEEPPANVKAGWKENHATFMNELKNLQSTGLTSMGESLKNAFDLLNLNRMQSGIDTYGQGRCPFYLEPSVIIVITDGGRYSYRTGIQQDIILPLSTHIPGTKLTKEPFRWDQRLYSLVLRMSGNKIDERLEGKVPHDDSPIERMCEVTGGRSYKVRSQYVLNQCIESLVQKVQPGVVLQFEPFPLTKDNESGQDLLFQPLKKMIYVTKHITQKTFPIGFWPIPEPYWPDPKAISLPARDAHPKLKVITSPVDEPQMVHNFPVDKYEIEASPLTLQILQKRELKKCWQVIICNGMHGFELPFGYLKASSTSSQVHLYVLAYNYPALLPLVNDLIHKYNMGPPNDLVYKFNTYVRSIPPYYCPFLRKALLTVSVPYQLLQFLFPENIDNYISPNIANQLKHIKNTAKQDQENLCMKVYKQLKLQKPPYRQVEMAKINPGVQLRRDLIRHPLLRDTFAKLHSDIETMDNYSVVIPQLTRQASAKSYRNPFDIPRRDLIEEIGRMREAFFKPQYTGLVAKDAGHCLLISEMGNYQEYLKNKDNPLREIEPTNVRQHMFGNPYKKDKHMVMVDEADLNDVSPMKGGSGSNCSTNSNLSATNTNIAGSTSIPKKVEASRPRKRKAGPLRMDFVYRRNTTDSTASRSRSSSSCSSSRCSSPASNFSDFSENEDSIPNASQQLALPHNAPKERDQQDRVLMNFSEFPEEEISENYFPLNGYVRDFINGVCAENNVDNSKANATNSPPENLQQSMGGIPQTPLANGLTLLHTNYRTVLPATPSAAPSIHNYVVINNNGLPSNNAVTSSGVYNSQSPLSLQHQLQQQQQQQQQQQNLPQPQIQQQQQQQQASNDSALHAQQGEGVTHASTLSLAAGSSSVSTSGYHQHTPTPHTHNDINDAQEISRILQQCHNGGGGGVSPANAISTVNSSASLGQIKPNTHTESASIPTLSNSKINRQSSVRTNCNSNNHSSNHQQQPEDYDNHHPAHVVVMTLNEEQREQAKKYNLDLRAQIFRDIRRPGRNYSRLLEHLNLIRGDIDMKSNFIEMCIGESLRFRRKQMVNSIRDWWEKKQQQLEMAS